MALASLVLMGLVLAGTSAQKDECAPRLELRVLEPGGSEARVRRNCLSNWDLDARFLYCVRCPKGEIPKPWCDKPEPVHWAMGEGSTEFFVEPGQRYVYAYVGRDIAPIEGEVTIAPDTSVTVRELRVESTVKKEMLRIRVSRPDGTRIAHDFQVKIESLVTGLLLFKSEKPSNESTYGDRLPVGRYRVRVETEENSQMCLTWPLPEPAPFGDWVQIVDLRAGQPVELDATMWFGGKLRVRLDLPRDLPSREESWSKQFPTQSEPKEADWLNLGSCGPGARVMLRPDPNSVVAPRERGMPAFDGAPVRFFFQPRLMVHYQYDTLLPGDEQTSADWIPPGAYIARVEARDFAPVEAKVRIQVGETTELRIKLVPR